MRTSSARTATGNLFSEDSREAQFKPPKPEPDAKPELDTKPETDIEPDIMAEVNLPCTVEGCKFKKSFQKLSGPIVSEL